MSNEWYKKGEEGVEDVKEYEEDRASRASGIYRLWVKAGSSTEFTFLDSEGFFFKEHNYYHRGSWLNWETCIQDIGKEDCPFCENGIRTYYECMFSVIDHASYESKKTPGKIITNSKKLLVLRSTARKKVLRKKDQLEGDLTFARFSTHRDDPKECNTGEDFEMKQRYTKEEVMAMAPTEYMGQAITPEAWIQPYDYPLIFSPKAAAALGRIIGRVAPAGSGDQPSMGSENNENEAKEESGATGEAAPSVQDLINK